MRIVSTFGLGFGLVFAAFGLSVTITSLRTLSDATVLQHLDEQLIPAVDLALEARNSFESFRHGCEDSVLFGEPTTLARAADDLLSLDHILSQLQTNSGLEAAHRDVAANLHRDLNAHGLRAQAAYHRMLGGGTDTSAEAVALTSESELLVTRLDHQYATLRSAMRLVLQERIRQGVYDRTLSLTLLLSLFAVCGVGLILLLRTLTFRLRRLVRASLALQAGDYGSPIVADNPDELGQLAGTFDSMRIAIEHRTNELKTINQDLDGLVQQRTGLLQERNQQLTYEIEERGRAEAATALVQEALAQTGDGVLLLRAHERFAQPAEYLNAGCLTALRLTAGFDRSLPAAALLPDAVIPPQLEAAAMAAAAGEHLRVELTLHHPGFGEDVCEWMFHPIRNRSGGIQHILALVRNITDRRLAEAEREQGRKLESIGQLAAGIAHEINTPIQFIGDNLDFIENAVRDLARGMTALTPLSTAEPPTSAAMAAHTLLVELDTDYLLSELPNAVEQSRDGVVRVAEIVKALKEFSHPDQGSFQDVDINRAIRTTTTIARSEYKYVADLELNLADDLPPVPCMPGEINQVMLNLLVNAAHAIEDVVAKKGGKGRIIVATRCIDNELEITISDSGGGIPENIRERIFDPFFTTKSVGKGTGQGLYIARNVIIKHHQGTLDFNSVPGCGTTFVIRLPLHRPVDMPACG